MKQLILDIARAPAPTLDNFVPGRNAEVVVALYAIANGASDERFVYLWGADGSGRSHLLQAAMHAARARGRAALAFSAGSEGHDIPEDALVTADDVHLFGAVAQIGLFNVHIRLAAGSGVLLASGDVPPAQLTLRADLATRFGAGLVYQVHELNDDEKAAALHGYAAARGFRLPADACSYLLRHAQRDMRSLQALLDALDRHSLATRRAVTVSLLRDLLNTETTDNHG